MDWREEKMKTETMFYFWQYCELDNIKPPAHQEHKIKLNVLLNAQLKE